MSHNLTDRDRRYSAASRAARWKRLRRIGASLSYLTLIAWAVSVVRYVGFGVEANKTCGGDVALGGGVIQLSYGAIRHKGDADSVFADICRQNLRDWRAGGYALGLDYSDRIARNLGLELPEWHASTGPWRVYSGQRTKGVGARASIPLWLIFWSFAIPTELAYWMSRKPLPGICPACGYDLTGNTSGRCPECGALDTSDAGSPATPLPQPAALHSLL